MISAIGFFLTLTLVKFVFNTCSVFLRIWTW